MASSMSFAAARFSWSSSSNNRMAVCRFARLCVAVVRRDSVRFGSSSGGGETGSGSDDNDKKAKMSNLMRQILSMKVSGASSDSPSPSIDLAMPSGKWKQVRNQMKEDYETERKLEREGLNKDLVSAVRVVASHVSGDKDKTESELVDRLKRHGEETKAAREGATINLSDTIAGMKIDRVGSKRSPETSMAFEKADVFSQARVEDRRGQTLASPEHRKALRRVANVEDMFGAKPLGIFTGEKWLSEEDESRQLPTLTVWDKLSRRELDVLVLQPLSNGFEEMITWTKQGKLWHFPIDNEQGMDEEAAVGFDEHIFLEVHLEQGFPKTGPVRHFMELVAVGLSKNPYMSIKRKIEHIDWFRNYFMEKEHILKELTTL